jgi:hypothetical protein
MPYATMPNDNGPPAHIDMLFEQTYGITAPPIPPPATGADEVPGGPGDFQPSGCQTPTVAQLTSNPVVANPLTAWQTGSHMGAFDGDAYWDGTAWVTGIAP